MIIIEVTGAIFDQLVPPCSGKSVRTNMTTASGMSTVKSKNTTKAGLAVETMSAPNPFCPNTKGVCCLMVLTNLSLILICIGFIIVLQLTDPPVVWSVHNYVELINFDFQLSVV